MMLQYIPIGPARAGGAVLTGIGVAEVTLGQNHGVNVTWQIQIDSSETYYMWQLAVRVELESELNLTEEGRVMKEVALSYSK